MSRVPHPNAVSSLHMSSQGVRGKSFRASYPKTFNWRMQGEAKRGYGRNGEDARVRAKYKGVESEGQGELL